MVRMIVLEEIKPTTTEISRESKKSGVEKQDVEPFTNIVLRAVAELHEGNFARYGIRPREFLHWKRKS